MDHFKNLREPVPHLVAQDMALERDVIPPLCVPTIEGMDVDADRGHSGTDLLPQTAPGPDHVAMETIGRMDNPQSIWGHRLRQNIRGRLMRRGVDMALIDGPESTSSQGQILPRDVPLPEGDDVDVDEAAQGSLSWAQDVSVWPRMLLETIGTHKPGICKLCTRTMTNITRHHVHPKVNSARRPPPGVADRSKNYLETTIDLCRPCHSMIHHIIPNKLMSDSYYSQSLLETHPRVQAWISWVRRQRIPTPRPFTQPASTRFVRSARGKKAKKIKGNSENVPAPTRILRSDKTRLAGLIKGTAEHAITSREKSRFSTSNIKDALAKLWIDSGNNIPSQFVDLPALQKKLSELTSGERIRVKNIQKVMAYDDKYHGWYKRLFPDKLMRLSRLTAQRKGMRPEGELIGMIKDALDKIWHEYGNDFPKPLVIGQAKGKALRNAVRFRMQGAVGGSISTKFNVEQLQKCMQLDAKYRTWFEWTYPGLIWVQAAQTVTQHNEIEDDDKDSEVEHRDTPGDSRLRHGPIPFHQTGTGTGSRGDPIAIDLTDEEDETLRPVGQGNVTVSSSKRVVIDLTLDDHEEPEIGQVQHTDEDENALPGFFFDVGARQWLPSKDRDGHVSHA
ncbi:hypothetical protein N0V82_006904 [Gnomoniopsis sp. IMI 355080]|nr:hypothetical protein N0V82_006904 [Gnomoniopsis sp. IMI 355080]